MCGEHPGSPATTSATSGSSPRVRGTRTSCACWCRRSPVHPRVCGEHLVKVFPVCLANGSSPRVRGTPDRRGKPVRGRRFIPACAGNTPASGCRWPTSQVHPRVCGEHRGATDPAGTASGSSPRVRGTRQPPPACGSGRRFIPACAGNTRCDGRLPCQSSGSSPRVRGTRDRRRCGAHAARFIPACAGNTLYAPARSSAAPVHPRVCGEHVNRNKTYLGAGGSSPRVRGTRSSNQKSCAPGWFIPACAGNTATSACWRQRHAHGSSPRVRGTR